MKTDPDSPWISLIFHPLTLATLVFAKVGCGFFLRSGVPALLCKDEFILFWGNCLLESLSLYLSFEWLLCLNFFWFSGLLLAFFLSFPVSFFCSSLSILKPRAELTAAAGAHVAQPPGVGQARQEGFHQGDQKDRPLYLAIAKRHSAHAKTTKLHAYFSSSVRQE